ncbi:MAG: response regulator [Synoicihabitans sp.]
MTKKLNCILLIDDDEATNFLHRLVLEDYGCAEKIMAVQKAEEGLKYLTTSKADIFPQPDLIFLDINMPGMNGWEFLEAYEKLETNQKGGLVIVMLTTSLNPDDEAAAGSKEKVMGFLSKPLNEAKITKILRDHFPEVLEDGA